MHTPFSAPRGGYARGTEYGSQGSATFKAGTFGKRKAINFHAVILNLIMPSLLFTALYFSECFSVHYKQALLVYGLLLGGLGLAALLGLMAFRARDKGLDPSWYAFSALAVVGAVVLAAFFGEINYHYNMRPYYDLENLHTYPAVNPARDKGQQLMDAGMVTFAEGSSIDVSKSMGFKNKDIYCVAPISFGKGTLQSYDFWAVGVNCCTSGSPDFSCGEFANRKAHSGLRLMREDQRPFFRLAVQQAEAAYKVRSVHPLFFTWTEDPSVYTVQLRESGYKYFVMGIAMHFAVNFFAVCGAVLAFSKLS